MAGTRRMPAVGPDGAVSGPSGVLGWDRARFPKLLVVGVTGLDASELAGRLGLTAAEWSYVWTPSQVQRCQPRQPWVVTEAFARGTWGEKENRLLDELSFCRALLLADVC